MISPTGKAKSLLKVKETTNQLYCDFEEVMTDIHLSYSLKNECKVMNYFEKCFEDLCLRSNESKTQNKVSKVIFSNYLSLPLIVCDKIFRIIQKREGDFLTKEDFMDGMFKMYFGSLENLVEFTFQILDFIQEGLVRIGNVRLFLNYLSTSVGEIKTKKEDSSYVEEVLFQFFKGSSELDFTCFKQRTIDENSDLFFLILSMLNLKQPFTINSIRFFISNYNSNSKDILNKFAEANGKNKNNSQSVCVITNRIKWMSLELSEYLRLLCEENESESNSNSNNNNNNIKANNIKANNTNNKFNHFLTKDSNSTAFSKNSSESSSDSDSESSFKPKQTHQAAKHQVLNPTFEVITHKLLDNTQILTYKLMLIDNNLFSFRFSKSRSTFLLCEVFPLNGYFVTESQDVTFKSQNYFTVALVNQFGNTFANLGNVFFFTDKAERAIFLTQLKYVMNIRDLEDYYLPVHNTIGTGQFSQVNLAVEKKTGVNVAVKTIKKKALNDKEICYLQSEIDILKFLMKRRNCNINSNDNLHENVIGVLDILEDRNFIYIVQEYADGGTLESYLLNQKKTLKSEEIKSLAKQVASGLEFLHNNGIVHRDLKPENILICSKSASKSVSKSVNIINNNSSFAKSPILIKITDFGLSTLQGVNEKTNVSCGTLLFTAPEILYRSFYNNKVDIWSFGILLYYMFTGLFPFDGEKLTLKEIAKLICLKPLNFDDFIANCEELQYMKDMRNIFQLISDCLRKDREARNSIDQVLLSNWFVQ